MENNLSFNTSEMEPLAQMTLPESVKTEVSGKIFGVQVQEALVNCLFFIKI